MKATFTQPFLRQYQALPQPVQGSFQKQLGLLLKNLHHPSLRAKRMKGFEDIWEARVTKNYRFTFQIKGDTYILRKIGTHDLLRHPWTQFC